MAGKLKRMDIASIPGAQKNGVRSMICCGVRTRSEAMTVAEAFIADLEKEKAKRSARSSAKPNS